jgi:hypothetical protein
MGWEVEVSVEEDSGGAHVARRVTVTGCVLIVGPMCLLAGARCPFLYARFLCLCLPACICVCSVCLLTSLAPAAVLHELALITVIISLV